MSRPPMRVPPQGRPTPTEIARAGPLVQPVVVPLPPPPIPATVAKPGLLAAHLQPRTDDQPPHLIVTARAGTGKTTTLVEGLRLVMGGRSELTPSTQQAAVWAEMERSRGVKSVCFVAFNRSIATELQARVPQGVQAMTMHSMGFRAVQNALDRVAPEDRNVEEVLAEVMGADLRELRATRGTLMAAVRELVGHCKKSLVTDMSDESLQRLASHYEVDLDRNRDEVFGLVPKVLERCKRPKGKIDFDDMIWLPIVLNLPVHRHDLLLVDEAQDLNRCQQELAVRAGRRLILCGDDKQAIYGFAGADSESLDRMRVTLQGPRCPGCDHQGSQGCIDDGEDFVVCSVCKGRGTQSRGCVALPLTVTRRCGRAIVREANKLVKDFDAHESNGEGLVSEARYPIQGGGKNRDGSERPRTVLPDDQTYLPLVGDGDMVLCRVNAPLVSQCFKFLKMGRRANIQGRDVGQGLISTIKKLAGKGGCTVAELVGKVSDWVHAETGKERAKRTPSENRIINIEDRGDCIVCLTEGMESVEALIRRVEAIFTDSKDRTGIRLSSIHRAKGLEASRVFFLMPDGSGCPHPCAKSAWQRGQEDNLLYVGITRAIHELTYVR